jgi:hypothetical protein
MRTKENQSIFKRRYVRILVFTSLIIILYLLSALSSFAIEVDTVKAKQVGKNFILPMLQKHTNLKSLRVSEINLQLANTVYENGTPMFYIFNVANSKGFIIISADDAVHPILGYSFENNYFEEDKRPDAFDDLLNNFSRQIEHAKQKNQEPSKSVKLHWDRYSSSNESTNKTNKSMQFTAFSDISPLLTTKWNQGCNYNSYCPADAAGPCGRTWAGCVAVSQAQVMKYWNYPATGEGSHSYATKYGTHSADFAATAYNWPGMGNTSGSDTEIDKLLYHVGVSVNMGYGASGSGAYMSATAYSVINYFKYSTNALCTYKSGYSDASWQALLNTELSEGRPLMYAGGSHAYVIDGVQNNNYFHVNWGWGGSYDGYFYLNNLKPGGSDFTSSQCAIVGVIPRTLYQGIDTNKIIPISCGAVYNDSTTNAENRVNKYKSNYMPCTGKEKIYSIITGFPGRLKAKISGLNGKKFNIFILNYPSSDSLLSYGDSTAYFDASKSGKYYISVDGTYGDEGKYSLVVSCPDANPDLVITTNQVTPYSVESNQINVSLKCSIKNIGNSTAITSKMFFYYSEDKILNTGDIKIDSVTVSNIAAGNTTEISKSVNMPAMTSGTRYILFIADANNLISETDETDNMAVSSIQVVPPGIMNCANAVSLNSGVWYNGNTKLNGDSTLHTYMHLTNMTGKEIIHTITASYNGVASIEFSESIMGELSCLVLNGCNENLLDRLIRIWNKDDTITRQEYEVSKNTTYYFVVDAENFLSGAYNIRITMPDSCPEPLITAGSDTNRCENSGTVFLSTNYGYSQYQWFNNGFAIPNENKNYLQTSENGNFYVAVTENGCTSNSNKIKIQYSSKPSGASIGASGDTIFCGGGNVSLSVTSATGYSYQWTVDNIKIPGETGLTYNATKSGSYRVEVTSKSCTIKSNAIKVEAKALSGNIGDTLKVNETDLITYYPFNGSSDYLDMSGNNNYNYANNSYLAYDRYNKYNKAYYLPGVLSYISTSKKFLHPDTFTLSIWFKTNTTRGGRLIGFGDQQYNTLSTHSDRHIYMDNSGKLHFGVNNGSKSVISSVKSYNDDIWHMVTAILSNNGMKLYIDTVLVASSNTPTSGEAYLGAWKIGWDNLTGWPNQPDSLYYKGYIDDVRIFKRELTINEIHLLYSTKITGIETSPSVICSASGRSKIYIHNSQAGVSYQLRNNLNNLNIGSPVTGNGGNIYMETETITANSSYNIFAQHPVTGCGYQLSPTINIKVVNLSKPSVLAKGTDSIQASYTAGSYEWYRDDILIVPINCTIKPPTSGIYKVIVCQDGCKSIISDGYGFVATEKTDFSTFQKINVFPNPTSGRITITKGSSDNFFLEITNLEGKTIFKEKLEGTAQEIDLTKNSKGIYIIRIYGNNFNKIEKIVLK